MATLKSTSDYLTDAVNQQNRLATILTNKGSTASGSEKFNSLIDKVEQIPSVSDFFNSSEYLKGSAIGSAVRMDDVSQF